MAHFAKIGLNNKVIGVLKVADEDCQGADGTELESVGIEFLEKKFGWPLWIKTSYNTHRNQYFNSDGTLADDQSKAFRGNYAAVGGTWDEDAELFYHPKTFASWIKDPINAKWVAPVSYPTITTYEEDGETKEWHIFWDEENQKWKGKAEKLPGGLPACTHEWNTSTLSWDTI